jgi:hypothetical protein
MMGRARVTPMSLTSIQPGQEGRQWPWPCGSTRQRHLWAIAYPNCAEIALSVA